VVTCPNCGEENQDRFRLCGFCGTPLVLEPEVHAVDHRSHTAGAALQDEHALASAGRVVAAAVPPNPLPMTIAS